MAAEWSSRAKSEDRNYGTRNLSAMPCGNRTRFTHVSDDRSVNYVAGASTCIFERERERERKRERERGREREKSARCELQLRNAFEISISRSRLSSSFARNVPRAVE
jgi:hypothetical protein